MTAATVRSEHASHLAGVDVDGTTTDQVFALGTQAQGVDGVVWQYVQAGGALTQYDWVAIDENGQAVAGTKALADVGHTIGFAQVAFADNAYGWVARTGASINCRLASACAADVALFTTATAGVLDDISTSQTKVQGVRSVTTITDGAGSEIVANWPQIAEAP